MYRAILHFNTGNTKSPVATLKTQPYKDLADLDHLLLVFSNANEKTRPTGFHIEVYFAGPGWVIWDPTEKEYNDVLRQSNANDCDQRTESGKESTEEEESDQCPV